MPALVIQLIGRMRVIFCATCVLAGLFVTGCGSNEITSKILSTSSNDPTSAVLTPTSISTTYEAPTPLSTAELLTAKDRWEKLFKSLERCSDAADTNCYQNAGTGSFNGSPIAATLQCIYMKYSNGQYGCKWEIKFYRFSSFKWSYSDWVYSLQSEMFDGALFAEMTGDTNSELYFSVMNISFAEAEVLSFKEGEWSRATFDGQSVLYMGYFNSKTGKMESGVSLDMGKPCDYRRWTKLVYSWDETEFKAVSGLDENENPISLNKALECN
jgi:hypothetical protein